MTAVPKYRNESIFQVLTKIETVATLKEIIKDEQISFVGQCDDSSMVILRPLPGSGVQKLMGEVRFITKIHFPQTAIFSFTFKDNKYFFKATLESQSGNIIEILPSSYFYMIQRRENTRMRIPPEFYAMFKFTHLDGRPIKAFGKIANISAGGVGLELRGEDYQIQVGQTIKGVMTLSRRPPEDIEIKVCHISVGDDDEGRTIQRFGGQFLPVNSPLHLRKMKSILGELQREIFKDMENSKLKL